MPWLTFFETAMHKWHLNYDQGELMLQRSPVSSWLRHAPRSGNWLCPPLYTCGSDTQETFCGVPNLRVRVFAIFCAHRCTRVEAIPGPEQHFVVFRSSGLGYLRTIAATIDGEYPGHPSSSSPMPSAQLS